MAKFKSGDVVEHNGQWQIVCTIMRILDVQVTYITGGTNFNHMYAVSSDEIKPVTYKR